MNLEKAIKYLNELKQTMAMSFWSKEYVDFRIEAIDTVLTALDERYKKGYQDGFKQAKFDCEMDKLNEPSERIIKIKDEYLLLIDNFLVDYNGCNTVESLKELIDETRDYIHKALKNDDKTVIYEGMKNKFNILHEEVE